MNETLSPCRVTAIPNGDGTYALRFELHNAGDTPVELSTYEPFTSFSVSAMVEGKAVSVHQPVLDIPVNPITLTVPRAGAITVDTPIRIRMESNAGPGTDGFVWTIPYPAAKVKLAITPDLPAPFNQPCQVTVK